jgi:hypothetical protein
MVFTGIVQGTAEVGLAVAQGRGSLVDSIPSHVYSPRFGSCSVPQSSKMTARQARRMRND